MSSIKVDPYAKFGLWDFEVYDPVVLSRKVSEFAITLGGGAE